MIDKRPARIAAMFDAIAPRYDLLNHVLSIGLDRAWRRKAIRALALTGREHLLDLCTGTGDLALAAMNGAPPARLVTGVDMADAMLQRGRAKVDYRSAGRAAPLAIAFARADVTRLPLADASVDACVVAFGIRNVEALDQALADVRRVLRPGGRFVILEFGTPRRRVVAVVTRAVVHAIVPLVGRLVSGHGRAYSYLPESMDAFPSGPALVARLERAGFADAGFEALVPGLVYLYVARRAPL